MFLVVCPIKECYSIIKSYGNNDWQTGQTVHVSWIWSDVGLKKMPNWITSDSSEKI